MALGRREQDDRDHYANKRLDLGGPLLASLFRQLFRKLVKDVRNYVQARAPPARPARPPAGCPRSPPLQRTEHAAGPVLRSARQKKALRVRVVVHVSFSLLPSTVLAEPRAACPPAAEPRAARGAPHACTPRPRAAPTRRERAQKCVDRGREINLTAAVNKDTLTRGLRYSIATGNWGMQGTAGLRAGVSQARPGRPAAGLHNSGHGPVLAGVQ